MDYKDGEVVVRRVDGVVLAALRMTAANRALGLSALVREILGGYVETDEAAKMFYEMAQREAAAELPDPS
jgi:plasmid stability protein